MHDHLLRVVAMSGRINDDPQLYRNLQSKIESLGNSSLIIGGDWNVLLNYSRVQLITCIKIMKSHINKFS